MKRFCNICSCVSKGPKADRLTLRPKNQSNDKTRPLHTQAAIMHYQLLALLPLLAHALAAPAPATDPSRIIARAGDGDGPKLYITLKSGVGLTAGNFMQFGVPLKPNDTGEKAGGRSEGEAAERGYRLPGDRPRDDGKIATELGIYPLAGWTWYNGQPRPGDDEGLQRTKVQFFMQDDGAGKSRMTMVSVFLLFPFQCLTQCRMQGGAGPVGAR